MCIQGTTSSLIEGFTFLGVFFQDFKILDACYGRVPLHGVIISIC
jgi:hypothetical protein